MKINEVFRSYDLTEDQELLINKLDDFLNNNTNNVFVLKGKAGTGKTFIIKGLTEYLQTKNRNFILAATTGKAATVISKKTGFSAYTIHKTIYSYSDLKEYSDKVLGSETYKFYFDIAININKEDLVLIIDEASMISDTYSELEFFRWGSGYILKDIFTFMNFDENKYTKKIIFIGDDAQLPPVKMNFSPAIDEKYLREKYSARTTSFSLNTIVRQKKESGISNNANILRESIAKNKFYKLEINFLYDDIHKISGENLVDSYIDNYCKSKEDGSILIAYSNAEVLKYNYEIRSRLFNSDDVLIRSGDKIVSNKNTLQYGKLICNGDFGEIVDVNNELIERNIVIKNRNKNTDIVEEINVPLKFRKILVNFKDINFRDQIFEAFCIENLLHSTNPILTSNENKALYIDFCIRHPELKKNTQEFKNMLRSDPFFNCLQIKFGYAITCHKSQGSEWKNVYVKCSNTIPVLSINYFRWLYTAMTRASENLYLLNPPNIKIYSGLKVTKIPFLKF